MALTAIVAVLCTAGRYLGPTDAIGVVLMAAILLAPSVMVTLLAPFKTMTLVTRQRLTFGFLALLGLPAIIAAVFVDPSLSAFIFLFTFSIWAVQFALLKDLHSA
jgi:hypothetical protein